MGTRLLAVAAGGVSIALWILGVPQLVVKSSAGPAGTSSEVSAQGDLQAALDAARPGDTITLRAGGVYRGPFRLPRKEGDGWIVIQSNTTRWPFGGLPRAGTRVDPTDAVRMPTLTAASGSVLSADPGAHHYRFIGLRIAPAPGVFLYNLVELGPGGAVSGPIPHDFDFQRCYLHGDPLKGTRRGIAMNAAGITVSDSYLSDFKEVGADAQAIAGWNGPGPYAIVNSYLEGSGENVMFGGADPSIAGLVPSDISILRNTFSKPLSWRVGDRSYAGTPWSVKNLLELKNARRVKIRGNVFEFNWPHAQNGFAILFTVRNQDGRAPWSIVEDVEFSDNIVRHVAGGMNILGFDDIFRSQQTRGVVVRNNLFYDVGGSWGDGRLFQVLNGAADVVFEHNTGDQTGTPVFAGDNLPHTGFVFRDNLVAGNQYGVIGSNQGPGRASIDRYFPGAVFRGNVIVGARAGDYPDGNFFPPRLADVGWVDARRGNYRLLSSSPFKRKATDGSDPGVNLDALLLAQAGAPAAVPRAPFGAAVVFWTAAGLIGYTYVGYGALTWLWATLRPRPFGRRPVRPLVSVVVITYNEETRIEQRLENLLASDYPADRLNVVVALDGSTDESLRRARSFPQVRVVACTERRGKASVLNEIVPHLDADIVVFADARQSFDRHAITALVEPFSDPAVGAVSGELLIVPDGTDDVTARGIGAYWSCEKLIRGWESRIDSTVGTTGAIYAIRRELFEPLAGDTLLDDVVIPLRIARTGRRVVFEPEARAFDRPTISGADEFERKVRTIAGTFQLFARERWIWNPRLNRLWLQTFSHKGLRLVLPALSLVVLLSNLALLGDASYRWILAAQVVFYLSALAAHAWPACRRRIRPLMVPYTICFLSSATVVGFARFMTGRQQVTWGRPARSAASVTVARQA